MMMTSVAARAVFGAGVVVLVLGVLTGCGSDATAGVAHDATAVATITRDPAASTASIKGAPDTTAIVGKPYVFQPQVTVPTAQPVVFSIKNAPAWARFNSSTGELSGTPGSSQVGAHAGITITVTQGTLHASLAPFTITVEATNSSGNVTLSWLPPTENADGSPLLNLKGYKVHYGAASKDYSKSVEVPNPGLTSYVVENLTAGKYYFAITTYNTEGRESSLSAEVSTMVD